ncbi:MAG: LuxR C-terminal-related transcriptional regulator [Acidimicrobiales bacterium]
MTVSVLRPGSPAATVRVAIVNDYDVVVAGVQALLAEHGRHIEVVELVTNEAVGTHVDIALYDAFAQSDLDLSRLRSIVANPHAADVVVYTWNFDGQLVDAALEAGAKGYLAKSLSGTELVRSLDRVAAGETVVQPGVGRALAIDDLEWPGKSVGLTEREAEILSLIVQGLSNVEIAAVVHLSINTIKGHIRTCYRKIGATNRVDAVLWGTAHGMRPDHDRIAGWSTSGG